MIASLTSTSFYITGGTLSTSASSYVVRQGDNDLYQYLCGGEFCYVLNSRQMGESSLMVRTAEKLKAEGVSVAVLDLTSIGQNLTPEQWYDGLLVRLGKQLDLEDAPLSAAFGLGGTLRCARSCVADTEPERGSTHRQDRWT